MARNRYIKDYRIVETVNERGRIRSNYEYIGAAYVFAADAKTLYRARRFALAACLIGWLAFLGALLPNSTAMRTFYVSLPFAFAALPLWLLTEDAVFAFRAKEPLEHRHADRLANRYPAAAVFTAALPAVSLIGELVTLLRGLDLRAGDIAFTLFAALLLGCGAVSYRGRKNLLCRKAD